MEICAALQKWASVLGLVLDILGAVLVYLGVRITIDKANALEQVAVASMIDDVSMRLVEQNEELSRARARERVRARNWAAAGLACFITGFILQAIGNWPK